MKRNIIRKKIMLIFIIFSFFSTQIFSQNQYNENDLKGKKYKEKLIGGWILDFSKTDDNGKNLIGIKTDKNKEILYYPYRADSEYIYIKADNQKTIKYSISSECKELKIFLDGNEFIELTETNELYMNVAKKVGTGILGVTAIILGGTQINNQSGNN